MTRNALHSRRCESLHAPNTILRPVVKSSRVLVFAKSVQRACCLATAGALHAARQSTTVGISFCHLYSASLQCFLTNSSSCQSRCVRWAKQSGILHHQDRTTTVAGNMPSRQSRLRNLPMRSTLSRARSSSSRLGNVRQISDDGKGECRNRPHRKR